MRRQGGVGPSAKVTRSGSSLLFWVVIALGLGTMALGVAFAGRLDADITLTASPLIGKPMPNVSVERLVGEGQVSLADYEGEVLVVNFWASWCFSCRTEHAALNGAASAYSDVGVTFIGLAYQDERPDSLAFLDELGWGDPYVYGFDATSQAAIEFGVMGIPETFFIDRSGVVVGKVSGPVTPSLLNNTLDALVLGQTIDSQVVTDEVQNRSEP
jgi:cytochrome c biogenesis protein CcmG/thiol:disulfide interchange protein DsbE